MVANVLHDVMKTRHKLHVFAPARGDLRFFISRIGDFVAMEGEMRADVELYVSTKWFFFEKYLTLPFIG